MILQQLHREAALKRATIVLAEGEDPRVIQAAAAAQKQGLCSPVLVGDPDTVTRIAREAGLPLDVPVVEPARDPEFAELLAHLEKRSKNRSWSRQQLVDRARDRLYYACLRVATGRAAGAVMGAVATTAETMKAALRCVGPRQGLATVSSCFLMVLPDGRGLVYSDCGVVPDPSVRQLADIAQAAADSCRQLLRQEPRVALLSFSTLGSASHPRTEKVRETLQELRRRQVDFVVDGELQADAALEMEVARRKAPASPVAGRANVLIFPDLDSGNIAYKLTERLAGARAIGPLLQGLSGAVHDLSRGCSTEDIVNTMAVAALQGGSR